MRVPKRFSTVDIMLRNNNDDSVNVIIELNRHKDSGKYFSVCQRTSAVLTGKLCEEDTMKTSSQVHKLRPKALIIHELYIFILQAKSNAS